MANEKDKGPIYFLKKTSALSECESNIVDLRDHNYWREEITHAETSICTNMSKLECAVLLKLGVQKMSEGYQCGEVEAIPVICARSIQLAEMLENEPIREVARLIGEKIQVDVKEEVVRLIDCLKDMAQLLLEEFSHEAWNREFQEAHFKREDI